MRKCPKCGSVKGIITERRPDGNSRCGLCGYTEKTDLFCNTDESGEEMQIDKHGLFDTHKLNEKGFKEVKDFKSAFNDFVGLALSKMPEGREKSVFKTQIETAAFYGTKAIAGKEGNYEEIIRY